jgi:hypothetical protein
MGSTFALQSALLHSSIAVSKLVVLAGVAMPSSCSGTKRDAVPGRGTSRHLLPAAPLAVRANMQVCSTCSCRTAAEAQQMLMQHRGYQAAGVGCSI